MKCSLVNNAYDPRHTTDAVYFFDTDRQEFVALDSAIYERIRSGQMRL
jgi:hypothetical protein